MERVETFLRQNFWVVEVILIGILSALMGVLLATVIEGRFITVPERPKKRRRFSVVNKTSKKPKLFRSRYVVAKRNIFCSTCEPAKVTEEGKETAVASLMDAVLLATLVSDDPKWSMAAVRLKEPEEHIVLVGPGQKLAGADVINVTTRRVELRRDGRVEFLDLLSEGKGKGPKKSSHRYKPPGRKGSSVDKGIRKIGENKYEIDRRVVNDFLANAANLGRGARIVPNMKGGKTDGFRVYAVRPYSVFYKLGIRNGDVIRAVNNQDISSPDKALELFTKLRGASHLTISVERRRRPITMEYTIR